MLKMYHESTQSYEMWLADADRFAPGDPEARFDVLVNIGVNHRALGATKRGLERFLQAWEVGCNCAIMDPEKIEDARSRAVWEALTLRDFEVVKRLLPFGDAYLSKYPADTGVRARHFVDLGRFAFLQGDTASAKGYAGNAVTLAENDPVLLAIAFGVLYDCDKALGDVDAAMTSGLLAKGAAEMAELHEEVAHLREDLGRLWMKSPDQVIQSVFETLAWRNSGQDMRR
jgi:hypothetical protein